MAPRTRRVRAGSMPRITRLAGRSSEDGQRARTVGDVVHLEALTLESVAHQPADDVVAVDDQGAITAPEPRDGLPDPAAARPVRPCIRRLAG